MNLSGFMRTRVFDLVLVAIFWTGLVHAQDATEVKAYYLKSEQMITMREE